MHSFFNPTNFPGGLGWRPQKFDSRDYQIAKLGPLAAAPVAASMYKFVTKQWRQVGGSCVGHGSAGAYACYRNAQAAAGSVLPDFSPMFVYDCARMHDGWFPQDIGATVRSGVWSLANNGVATDSVWPAEASPSTTPSSDAYTDAALHIVTQYVGVSGAAQIKQALAAGYPVVFGATLYHSASSTMWGDQKVPIPPAYSGDAYWGGHCCYFTGYNDGPGVFNGIPPGYFEGINSWGNSNQRFFWPYNYNVSDCWTIQAEKNAPVVVRTMTKLDVQSAKLSLTGNNPTGQVLATFTYPGDGNNLPTSDTVIFNLDGSIAPPPPTPGGLLGNGSFELPATLSFIYNPTDTFWIFSARSGVQRNGSAWRAASAPDGVQTAMVQMLGTLSQKVQLDAGSYMLSGMAAQRGGYPSQTLKVLLDGAQIGLLQPPGLTFTPFSYPITIATAGVHEIGFVGTSGQDATVFLDSLNLQ